MRCSDARFWPSHGAGGVSGEALGDYFGGTRETLTLLSKGNGKTTLLGALALFEVCVRPDCEVVILAAARDQAAIMLRQAQGFIRRSPGLSARLHVTQRQVEHRELGGRIRILAADVDTADGVICDLALVDELHRHRNPEPYTLLRDGLGKRRGRMVTISTAGWDERSALGLLRGAALELTTVTRDGCHLVARSRDGMFAMHEWALPSDGDPHDMLQVKQANPLSTIAVADLQADHDRPGMRESAWRRYRCNQWVRTEDETWVPMGDFDACAA